MRFWASAAEQPLTPTPLSRSVAPRTTLTFDASYTENFIRPSARIAYFNSTLVSATITGLEPNVRTTFNRQGPDAFSDLKQIQGNLDLVRELLGGDAQRVAPELRLVDQQIERGLPGAQRRGVSRSLAFGLFKRRRHGLGGAAELHAARGDRLRIIPAGRAGERRGAEQQQGVEHDQSGFPSGPHGGRSA